MAMDGFVPLNERQAKLCIASGIDHPEEMAVIRETEDYLMMRHHASYNEVTISKSGTQKRKEQGIW